jgi:putative oxidoreductase
MVLGRLLMSAIFIQAGVSELFHLGGTMEYFRGLGLPLPGVLVWFVLAVEIFGGLALLLGYLTRWASSVLSLFAVAAGLIGHSHVGDTMQLQMLMKDIAIAGGLLYFVAHGAGLLSLDARREA